MSLTIYPDNTSSGGGTIGGLVTGGTAGSVLFVGAGGVLAQDNARFFYDDTNNQLQLSSGAVGNTPLKITLFAAQTADALQVLTSAGAGALSVTSDGTIRMGQSGDTTAASWSSIYRNSNGGIGMIANAISGDPFAFFGQSTTQGILFGSTYQVTWSPSTPGGAGPDIGIGRVAAGIVKVTDGSTGAGCLELLEQTAPSAATANSVRIYAQDNGGGKTQLMARFATGAAQQIAIEP